MSFPSIVRIATVNDSSEIWRLFLQSHKENGLFQLSPDKVKWFMKRCLVPESIAPDDIGMRGVIGVIGKPGQLEALAFICVGSFAWYSDEKAINDCLVYVDSECRKSNHAHALIEWMKEQVEITHLPLTAAVMTNHRTEAKCRLYQRMLPKVGEIFHLKPQLAAASS